LFFVFVCVFFLGYGGQVAICWGWGMIYNLNNRPKSVLLIDINI